MLQCERALGDHKRLDEIDCAKGIGILLVVVAHHLQNADSIRHWAFSFHMPLFFIMTGYLFAHKQSTASARQAIASGARSLLYPYCTFSVIIVAWLLGFKTVFHAALEEPVAEVIVRLLTTYGYHALWFLPVMFFASVVCKTCKPEYRRYLLVGAVAGGCAMSYAACSASLANSCARYAAIIAGRILLAISFVEIGRFVYALLQKLNANVEWIVMIAALVLSLMLYHANIWVSMAFSRIGNPVLYYVNALSGSIFVLLLSKKICIGIHTLRRALCYWGRNSLIVLALHMDISIEIAWMIVGAMKLTQVLSFRVASICAIFIELIILMILIQLINNHAPFLVRIPNLQNQKYSGEVS